MKNKKKSGGKLGEILENLGFISEETLLIFLAKQSHLTHVNLAEMPEIPKDILTIIPESIVRRQNVIPISREGMVLTVAIGDPFNISALDVLKIVTGCDVKFVVASASKIKQRIEELYRKRQPIGTGPGTAEEEKKPGEGKKDKDSKTPDKAEEKPEEEKKESLEKVLMESQAKVQPVVRVVDIMINNALESRASDIHLEPFEDTVQIRYRIDGVLQEQSAPPKSLYNAVVSRIKIMGSMDIAEKRLPQDGHIKLKHQGKNIDFRVSTIPTTFGEKIVMRVLDTSQALVSLNKLGFEPNELSIFENNIKKPYGLILITGPTGSGKTTTLYSALAVLNQPDKNIITIEDPLEYNLKGINQVQVKSEIGLHFSTGLRAFLRQDPDIIMVGEIRDKETAEIAINAALTGHLVFSTLHTNDTIGVISRLVNMGMESFLIASSLQMVIAQRLMRVLCSKCKEEYSISAKTLEHMNIPHEILKGKENITLYRAKGCDACRHTGYKGRMGCYEILDVDTSLRDAIITEPVTTLSAKALEKGMVPLYHSALKKLFDGITSVEEVMRVTLH